MFIAGAALSLGEIILLGRTGFLVYQGHMIGYGIMALAACGMALSRPDASRSRLTYYDTALFGIVYYIDRSDILHSRYHRRAYKYRVCSVLLRDSSTVVKRGDIICPEKEYYCETIFHKQ